MIKKLRMYQISLIAVSMICIGLLAFMGITAVQKSMKLNMSFQMNPSIYVKVEIYNTSTSKYETIFQNTNATEIKSGVILSGNHLQFANDYATTLGTSLKMKVTSLNEGITMLTEFSGASVTSGGNTITATATTYNVASAELTVSTLSNLTIQFSQVFTVDVSGVDTNSATISAGQNVYTINGTYYVKSTATNAQFTLTSKEHYQNPPASVTVNGATYEYTTTSEKGTLTLTKIDGNVSINASASAAIYTVSSNLSGISSNTIANKATYNTNYTFTLTVASTSWTMGAVTYTVGGGSAQTLTGTTTDNLTYTYTIPGDKITGAIVINATATSSYSIYATINGEDVLIGEYYQKSTEQPITINYPSTFTGTGDLMSAVTGVSEVTATQITIAANTTGPITIVPKGYTIGIYTDDSTDVAYNAAYSVENLKATEIYYTPYAGYKYIQFNGASSYLDDDGTTTRHLRWIIIGSATGDTTKYGEGGDENPYTLDSSGNETTTKELLDNECLMLSEQVVEVKKYDASNTSGQWNAGTSDIRIWLNGDFLTSTGLNNYKGSKIKPKNLYTSFMTNRDETSKTATYTSSNDYMFLLAYHRNATESPKYASYYLQDYMMERYLGDVGSSNGKIRTFSGASPSYWWLRSGTPSYANYAWYVSSGGEVNSHLVLFSLYGVRPSFILNLA